MQPIRAEPWLQLPSAMGTISKCGAVAAAQRTPMTPMPFKHPAPPPPPPHPKPPTPMTPMPSKQPADTYDTDAIQASTQPAARRQAAADPAASRRQAAAQAARSRKRPAPASNDSDADSSEERWRCATRLKGATFAAEGAKAANIADPSPANMAKAAKAVANAAKAAAMVFARSRKAKVLCLRLCLMARCGV